MDAVIRAIIIYFFLLLVFRLSGKRTFAETTPFDLVLLLIIAGTTEHALLGDDFSITNAALLIITLICLDIGLSLLKVRFPRIDKISEGISLIILEDGKPLHERMRKARIDEDDIRAAAREAHGLERLDQIKYAILEKSGGISIIPKSQS